MNLFVTKRNGHKEPIDLDKIHRVLDWAAEGLDHVSVSQVELKSHIQFYDGIRTADIHETVIKATADLISEQSPDYQYMAARLAIFHLRKKAYGQFEPPHLYQHVAKLVDMGKYDKHLLTDYTQAEFEELNEHLDHWRDMDFSYAAVKQLEGKYLVQNRVTGEIYESPQFLYILVAACLFSKYPKDTRLSYIKRFYDAVSTFKISLPTPIMSGVRTPTRQFSSCVLIECDDSLDSINATASAIVRYVSQRAGIGINAGRIRGLGSPIRGGEAFHTGCIPFYKYFQTAVKCCSQGGVRGGAATLFYPLWHTEVESLLVLKNNRGVEENRVRHMDYGVQINKLMYQRLIKGGDISLFSPSDAPGLYDAFFADQDKFEQLYVKYEQDPAIRKKTIKAVDLFSLMMQERAGTGRIYIQNVDHCNTHSPFDPSVAPVRQSNLCLEIALPTKPLNNVDDEEGEIALCTLSAFNLGAIEKLEDLEEMADLAVRDLDALLDYQDYPLKAAQKGSMNRRTLGIGVINYAYY
ncbi:MAG: class 1a ribonucleoside-diphosphate reductase subunit alpha, partial [Aeromonas molluscorum]